MIRRFLSFALWCIVLGALAVRLGPEYRDALAHAVSFVLAGIGIPMDIVHLDLVAPLDLALFAATALGVPGLSPAARILPMVSGLAITCLVEIASVVFWIALDLLSPGGSAMRESLRGDVMATIGWVTPVCVGALTLHAPLVALLRPGSRPAARDREHARAARASTAHGRSERERPHPKERPFVASIDPTR